MSKWSPAGTKTQSLQWADTTRCPQNSGYNSGCSEVPVAAKSVCLAGRNDIQLKANLLLLPPVRSLLGDDCRQLLHSR